jgi:hypothetical protein
MGATCCDGRVMGKLPFETARRGHSLILLTRGDGSVREAGEKCFQVREHTTREWRLHTEVAPQDGADTTLTGGEPCLQF